MRRIKKILSVLGGLTVFAALPVYAGPSSRPTVYQNLDHYVTLLNTVIDWLFVILMIFAVIMLLWAAFLYLTAGDDEEKLKKAKSIIIYAVIAVVIAIVANGVPTLIRTFLGA